MQDSTIYAYGTHMHSSTPLGFKSSLESAEYEQQLNSEELDNLCRLLINGFGKIEHKWRQMNSWLVFWTGVI